MIKVFREYVKNYDMNNPKIKLKYDHSFRVMKLSQDYARKLCFSEEDIELAKTIGLLHDIGRFEQLKVYDTYNDLKSIDHADYSVEQLFGKNEIRKFVSDNRHDDIIRMAIFNHNKLNITGVTSEQMDKHCKLIRDTDKLDILYNIVYLGDIEIKESVDNISKFVMEDIMAHRSVDKKHIQNKNDYICCWLAFSFDIAYDEVMPQVREYIEAIYNKLEHKEIFEDVYREVINYMEERMK